MKKTKLLVFLTAIVATLGIATGCSSEATTGQEKEKVETRIVTSLKGDTEIPVNPERIVDISGSSEELLILGHTPVATANVDSYETDKLPSYVAEAFKDTKIVGHSMLDTADVEGILSTNPDLIIMSKRQEKIYDQLKEIAPVVMIEDYANDWEDKLVDIAKLFDQEEDATKWLEAYEAKAKALGEEVLAKNGERTYLTVLASAGQFMVFSDAGLGAIISDDMNLARPENMPPQEGITLPMVSIEGLTEIDADHIIVIATESDKKDLEANSVWNEMRAVKEGNVTMLDAAPFFTQSYNPVGKELLLTSIKDELIK